MQRRFEEALKKLRADLDMKLAQRDELNEQLQLRKAGFASQREDSEANEDFDEGNSAELEGDLFGNLQDSPVAMETG